MEKAVGRGGLTRIGVDEKSFLKGHRYATILSDLDIARVLDVARDRKEESLAELFRTILEEQRQEIAAVAMDMWEPYINAVKALLPEADIVHDKFHIAKYLGEAVDKVRKAEHKGLKQDEEPNCTKRADPHAMQGRSLNRPFTTSG